MPSDSFFKDSVELIILESGTVNKTYFSQKEILEYRWDGENRPRVDKGSPIIQNEPDDVLEGVVKEVAKKIFFEEREIEESAFEEDSFGENAQEIKPEKTELKILEEKLSEYIDAEQFEKAAEIRDLLKKKREES